MKFTWFHLMPYTHLPTDFREKYWSVWVDVPRDLYDPKIGHCLYNEYLDELEFADQMGFDSIGVNEHHQNAYGMMPSPNIIIAALARRTRNASLVVLGNSIALYNPPVRVAEEFAMLDVISGGRLVAGFPVGTPMDANFCYGEVPATLREKYKEAHDLILRAWTEKRVYSFNGKYTKLRYVNLWPRPLQEPYPPVWVPGGTSIETWDLCADFGHQYASFRTLDTSRVRKLPMAIGELWRKEASHSIHIVWDSLRWSRLPRPTSRRSATTPRIWIIFTIAACTCTRDLRTRQVIARNVRLALP